MRICTKFSYENLQQIPPNRNPYEIVDGELFATPAPDTLHQRIVDKLFARLWIYDREHHLGDVFAAPYDTVFTSSTVLESDVLYVYRAHLQRIGEKYLSGAPDLVVEVTSESTSVLVREINPKQYARYGDAEYWLVDPDEKSVEVFHLKVGAYELAARVGFGETVTSRLFPGLTLSISSRWES